MMKANFSCYVVAISVLCCTLNSCEQSSNDKLESTPVDSIANMDTINVEKQAIVVDKAKQDSLDMLAQIEFIDQFYKNKWYKKEKKIRAHSSKKMIKQLRRDYDDMYAEGGGLAIWELSTLAQDGGVLVYQGAKKTGENTYVVRLKDNEFNSISIITLTLIKEDDEWKFDSCKIKMK